MKEAVHGDELGEQVQDLVDARIHQAFHPLLGEESAADRGIPLELNPLLRLLIELAGQRQLAQVKVRPEVTKDAAVAVLNVLHGG